MPVALPAAKEGKLAPATDEEALNRFALAYNAYVTALREGIVDLRLWRRTAEFWERLK